MASTIEALIQTPIYLSKNLPVTTVFYLDLTREQIRYKTTLQQLSDVVCWRSITSLQLHVLHSVISYAYSFLNVFYSLSVFLSLLCTNVSPFFFTYKYRYIWEISKFKGLIPPHFPRAAIRNPHWTGHHDIRTPESRQKTALNRRKRKE